MSRRWKVASAVVGALAVVGGGAAFAAGGGSRPRAHALTHARPFGLAGPVARSVGGEMRGGFGFRGHFGAGGIFAAAASYLGTTPSALFDQLRSGKTLAQIADQTSGKSAVGLIAALVADAKQKIAAAVTANKLTQTQADTITANLQQRITDLVNGTRPTTPGPFHGHFGFGGPRGNWGPPPPGSANT